MKNNFEVTLMKKLGNELIDAIYDYDLMKVKIILKNNKNLIIDHEYKGIKGITATYVATQNGHSDIVELLLPFSPNLKLTDKNGKNPIDISKTISNSHVQLLLKNHFYSWKKENHQIFTKEFKEGIFNLLLIIKRFNKENPRKFPRVLMEYLIKSFY
eukprot:TRINITY_DN16379_c0_g1_i1.p1 TRINITY_DN16379_c0_g1~~TRINITY_DN16379_c0_g1_i1.p1  ORF type:complete len:157 (-),score=33.70 TRINITY_DN16379_c0_g1_i1:28-498(-)